MSRTDREPPRATVTLRRHQWAEIVSGWELYRSVVPVEQHDARWRGAMPGLCQAVSRRLRQDRGDLVSVDGGIDSWRGVHLWILAVSRHGARPVTPSAMDAIAAQIATQEESWGVESKGEREAA